MKKTWIVFGASALLACQRPEKTVSQDPTPSSPWPMGEGRESDERHLSHFRVAPGQELALALPAREADPRAHISGISGELWVDEGDITRSHGWLEFDLSTLTLLGERGEPDAERTREARQWLGPWTEPSQKIARLEIASLAEASPRRFEQGDRVSSSHGRRVRGTLNARLTIRRVATDQKISIIADRIDSSGTVELRIRLHPKASVSLLEHDIVPRDAQGTPIAEDRSLLGRVVGSRALISGELRWIFAQ